MKKNTSLQSMKPQDLVVMAKLIACEEENWTQLKLAKELFMSQSEISTSLARCRYAGLLSYDGKTVHRKLFMDFVEFGLAVVFPQRAGPVVRGTPTAHSAYPLNEEIDSKEKYVWPYAKGKQRGQAILPLYPSAVKIADHDPIMYQMLSLMDAVRVGRAREKSLGIKHLKEMICLAIG